MGLKPKLCEKDQCTGCMACYNVCTCGAILMERDKRGFLFPVVDSNKCVHCSQCEKVCPSIRPAEIHNSVQDYYAFKHARNDVRNSSSSGGFFTWLSDIVLDKDGIVYGVVLDESLKAKHFRATSAAERNMMRGSKYVQSDVGKIYENVLNDLKESKLVLFSGTPCQCEALLLFLNNKVSTEKLITLDFICEGVASPQVFEDFKLYEEKKYRNKGKLKNLYFRDKNRYLYKKPPIFSRRLILEFNNDIGICEYVYDGIGNSRYLDSMFSGLTQRDACLKCRFHSYDRCTDFTCGDFHRYNGPEDFIDENGLSEVLVNSSKGIELVSNHISDKSFLRCTKEGVWQPLLTNHININMKKRNCFWEKYERKGYISATNILIPSICMRYILRKLKEIKRMIIKHGQ